jgi:RNA recognition motif-containing protein
MELKIVLPYGVWTNTNLCLDDPASDPQVRGDPFCTLFVSRLSYETTEHDLEKAFSTYGPIERVLTPYSQTFEEQN